MCTLTYAQISKKSYYYQCEKCCYRNDFFGEFLQFPKSFKIIYYIDILTSYNNDLKMKDESKEILEAKNVERSERAKKLYRYVNDVARRIGEMTSACQNTSELFSCNIEIQRQKLRDNCEKLMFLDPLNYGKKSLELLWRKVYYDTISCIKKLRETNTNAEDDSYINTLLACGIGNFHHFISRISSELNVQSKELDYTPLQYNEENLEVSQGLAEDQVLFGCSALHSCLIYLGDLSRYQVEIFQTFDPSIAARYYLQAAHVDMLSGMPYNQLGNLYLDKNYNLDSVCYYMQCLTCMNPFDGAMGNLSKIFEKNAQFCDSLHDTETFTQAEHVQSTVVQFISLTEIWYLNKDDTDVSQRCSGVAQGLKACMDFNKPTLPDHNRNYKEYTQATDDESNNPSYLNANLIHKIVLICLFTISKLEEIDDTKAFASKAFTLALLSQLLQKLLKQVEAMGLTNPAHKYNPKVSHDTKIDIAETELDIQKEDQNVTSDVLNGNKESEDLQVVVENETDKLQNGDVKSNGKKVATKRRRRRRVISSDSSDMSNEDDESSDEEDGTFELCSDEEISESYHSEDSESDVSYDGSDLEDNSEKNDSETKELQQKQIITNGDTITIVETESTKTTNINGKTEITELNVSELEKFLLGNNFLASIKLLTDWILLEKDLILSCGESGESLFQCVVDLLNIFSFHFNTKATEIDIDACNALKYANYAAKKLKLEYKTIPISEDINLRGTNICKFDKDAAEWQNLYKCKLSTFDENIIRILNFIEFGNQIAKIVPRIRFNKTLKIFYFKKILPPKLSTKIGHKRTREWHNSKKQHVEPVEGGLLRRLGRLWLVSQVRELERGQTAAPALLVLDAAALNKHLRCIKHLLRAKNYLLLIPTVVLQELDNLKREESSARDAIRWLEVQLKSGSRFLRAQRPGQAKPLPLLKYPRKAPPHIHNFIQMLEFCNHFQTDDNQGGNGDPDSSLQVKTTPMLILLVGNELGTDEEQYKEFSVTGAAQSAGISIEYIGDFYTKWRQALHKNAKKR